ncbi:MAG: DNA alkylation repair protein [Jhaorihella sp.]
MLNPYLDQIRAHADRTRATGQAAYHKVARTYLGVPNPVLNDLTRDWRRRLTLAERVQLADALWQSDIFEARIAAAKLLTQAGIRPDAAVWDLLQSWLPDFDSWAIADHACKAAENRIWADPARLDDVEHWTGSGQMWTRRAALVATLRWARLTDPGPHDLARRERILGWAAGYVADREWFIQKAVAWWLRDLGKRDPVRARAFLAQHATAMKPFARKEAGKYLTD